MFEIHVFRVFMLQRAQDTTVVRLYRRYLLQAIETPTIFSTLNLKYQQIPCYSADEDQFTYFCS